MTIAAHARDGNRETTQRVDRTAAPRQAARPRPEFHAVMPADVGRVGERGALILSVVRYATADGRAWRASHADIAAAMGSRASHDAIRRAIEKLVAAGELESCRASTGDQVKLYRIAPVERPVRVIASVVNRDSDAESRRDAKAPVAEQSSVDAEPRRSVESSVDAEPRRSNGDEQSLREIASVPKRRSPRTIPIPDRVLRTIGNHSRKNGPVTRSYLRRAVQGGDRTVFDEHWLAWIAAGHVVEAESGKWTVRGDGR